ncbi:universal stress protein [Paracoccus bogoriensis]|uniref:universal stress protein n=1 Tax=Paracoccus bogoriensis TaxID=242065 RepID=UPI001C66586D|nr:universal stress protein [Paracoccus bogoriensis]MBW7057360.1 universal stress protein [Paracoccus bogoriensis]
MSRILALVDGSIYGPSVARHAAWLAERLGLGVDLLHVTPRGEREAGQILLAESACIIKAHGVADLGVHLRQGELMATIRAVAPHLRAIVLGKRGESADFVSGRLGSNLERIVRGATVPVLVASRAFRPVQRVLLAFDGSASARSAVARMAKSPVFQGLEITLLHVGEPTPAVSVAIDEAILELVASGLRVMLRQMPGEPQEVLRPLVLDEGFDLLVMGAYGHSRIRNLFIGSTTTAMIRAALIPVLLYRQRAGLG